jgi:hypothetical protein
MRIEVLLLTTALAGAPLFDVHAAAGASGSGSGAPSGGAAFGTPPASGNAGASTSPGANNNAPAAPNTTAGPQTQPPPLLPNTNLFYAATNAGVANTNQSGSTNQVNVTNQFSNTNQVFVTNQFFSTNVVVITNRPGMGSSDQAASELDRALIVEVRQRIRRKDPGISASWDTVGLAANGGNILVSGQVLQLADKQSLLVLVQSTPGVVRVVDQVVVTPQLGAAGGSTGTVSRFLNPSSDPSLGDSHRFSSATNRFGQRVFLPPARGTLIATNPSPTGFTNPGSTNVILEGTVATNVIVIPVDTNAPNP